MANELITPAQMKRNIKRSALKVAKKDGLTRKQTRELIKAVTISLMGTGA